MWGILKKMLLYGVLILVVLEVLVRIFHLHNETPEWYLDEHQTYRYKAGQNGYMVYGNRRQQFSQYRINKFGYNSYREFEPKKESFEVAILGDSFIEGFHQDYFRSIGKKIENKIPNIEVYELGHSSFDFADQLHVVDTNPEMFENIDLIIFELKYVSDLRRNSYKVAPRKVVFPLLRKSKLLVYMLNQGMFDELKNLLKKINIGQESLAKRKGMDEDPKKFLDNFRTLIANSCVEPDKLVLLMDGRKTDQNFLEYIKKTDIKLIDYGHSFEQNKQKPTTLIYDRHWNDFGRTLVANEIIKFIEEEKK